MAVLPSLPSISVSVHNDKGQLPEYGDSQPDIVQDLESPSSVVVSNYIEAPPDGGPFWFKFRVEAPYIHGPHRIMFRYEIPGTNDDSGKSCGPSDLGNRGSWETAFKGYTGIDGRGPVFRDFWFGKLRILPGDEQRNGIFGTRKSKMESLGTLQIRVLLGKRLGNRTFDDFVVHKSMMTEATEQFAATKSLYTDKPLSAAAAAAWPSTFVDGWNHPIAVFQFKYRSRADLQKLQLIEKTPEPTQPPRENALPILPIIPVPLRARPLTPQPTEPARENTLPILPTTSVPSCPPSSTTQPAQPPRENTLPILPTTSVSSRAPSLTPALRLFEDLTFAEVRDLARKQHKGFDDLNGDEIENLARQKYSEEMEHADEGVGSSSSSSLPHGSRAFEELKFDEVWDLARSQHKDFRELNGHEIRKLAMQKHYGTRAASRGSLSETPDAGNGQGKRKAPIKPEDTDEDVIFVSGSKKRKQMATVPTDTKSQTEKS
ncbi:hypothetical protein VE04_06342 [Pseudogymnoascus sp. 24MN13]|nr:hypothetical protein VE04_06342 [Pseudogymnoascus sp. 24MN13]